MRHYSLLPLVGIAATAATLGGAYIAYVVHSKPDVSFHAKTWKKEGPPYQAVEPGENRRLLERRHEVSKPDPEIEELKREVGSYKKD